MRHLKAHTGGEPLQKMAVQVEVSCQRNLKNNGVIVHHTLEMMNAEVKQPRTHSVNSLIRN